MCESVIDRSTEAVVHPGRVNHWRRFAPFLLWLGAFLTAWFLLVHFTNAWSTVFEHWPIAVAMALGSYVAGSTPMGGGTIGFPILVLLFDQPAVIGRNFSFAVQSIGMVSASIFILCMGRPIAWSLLRWGMLGSLIGTPLGVAFIAPSVDGTIIKFLFAIIWASFGVMHLFRTHELVRRYGFISGRPGFDRWAGLVVGLLGGTLLASITGVGIDMLAYIVLVLLIRADVRIAVPTSVILMAFTSVLGFASNWLLSLVNSTTYEIAPAVYANWLAAAPIVAFGAPLGALMLYLINRTFTLIFVSILCVGQFIWTCISEQVGWPTVLVSVGCVVAFNVIFILMDRVGEWREQTAAAKLQ